MDPEPAAVSKPSNKVDASLRFSYQEASEELDDDDPYGLSGPSIALLGLTIAVAVVGVPLFAVVTDRPVERESLVPTTFKSDGSKSSSPFSLTRFGKSSR